MKDLNFNNKTFSLIQNSEKGTVNSKTIFLFKQKGDLVTADYHGGTVIYGKIIAILKNDTLDMRYQCLTTANLLRVGKANAAISLTKLGKIKLQLNWEWMEDKKESGVSEYLEN